MLLVFSQVQSEIVVANVWVSHTYTRAPKSCVRSFIHSVGDVCVCSMCVSVWLCSRFRLTRSIYMCSSYDTHRYGTTSESLCVFNARDWLTDWLTGWIFLIRSHFPGLQHRSDSSEIFEQGASTTTTTNFMNHVYDSIAATAAVAAAAAATASDHGNFWVCQCACICGSARYGLPKTINKHVCCACVRMVPEWL